MVDLPDEKRGCHRTGFQRKCRDLLLSGECNRWVQLTGKHPQTNADVSGYNCIDDWMLTVQMSNAQQIGQFAAATESFRNVLHVATKTIADFETLRTELLRVNEINLRITRQRQSWLPKLLGGNGHARLSRPQE